MLEVNGSVELSNSLATTVIECLSIFKCILIRIVAHLRGVEILASPPPPFDTQSTQDVPLNQIQNARSVHRKQRTADSFRSEDQYANAMKGRVLGERAKQLTGSGKRVEVWQVKVPCCGASSS